MLDLLFNGFLFFMAAVWLIGVFKHRSLSGLTGSLKKHGHILVPVIVWSIFAILAFSYVVWFDDFSARHDIPEAVESAVLDLSHGGNPYVDKVVPRFEKQYDGIGTGMDFGTYNYLPVDLLVYSGLHSALGFLGAPIWFVVSNILIWSTAFAVMYEFVPIKLRGYIPFAGTCTLFYSFDNGALTALLIVASVYCLKKLRPDRAIVSSIVFMGLAVMTKAFAVVPFAVLFLWLMEDKLRARRVRDWGLVTVSGASAAAFGLLIMLPFGVMNVLNSAVFFHMSLANRVGTSVGGTVLAEIAMGSQYYSYIAAAVVVLAIMASFRMKDLYDRIIISSIAFSMVSIKSSLALLIVPALFIVLRVRDWSVASDTVAEPVPLSTTMELDSALSSSK